MELTRSASAPGLRLPIQWLLALLAGLTAVFVLSALVAKLGAFIAMAGVTALLMGCALCLLPRAAAFIAVFLLYSNLVVVFAGSPLYQIVGRHRRSCSPCRLPISCSFVARLRASIASSA